MTLDRLSGLFGSFSIFPQKEEPKGIYYRILLYDVHTIIPLNTILYFYFYDSLVGTLRRQSSGVDLGSRYLQGS